MSRFKEILGRDVKNAFLNINEFAEELKIEQHKVKGIYEEEKVDRFGKEPYEIGYTNNNEKQMILSISKNDYKKIGNPIKGERITIENYSHEIKSLEKDDGIRIIKLKRFG